MTAAAVAVALSGSLAVAQPASAAGCSYDLYKPWLSFGSIYAGGNISGSDCPNEPFQVKLQSKSAGSWWTKASSGNFYPGGGTSVGIGCSSGTWRSVMTKYDVTVISSAEVKITC